MLGFRRTITFCTLLGYLVVSILSGTGHIILCQDNGGNVSVETSLSRCCMSESSILEFDVEHSCDGCNDIPLAELPSRESTEAISSVATQGAPVLTLSFAHPPTVDVVLGFFGLIYPVATTAESPPLPTSLFQLGSVVLRC